MGRVITLGSVNQDITVTTQRFPAAGETLTGSSVSYRLGGKGANQAAAAAHAGAESVFVGLVGDDAPGAMLREGLERHGVDTRRLGTVAGGSSGTAHITVDASGENTIIVVPGTNRLVDAALLDRIVPPLAASDVLVLQGEVPLAADVAAARAARGVGAVVILNLAPAVPLDQGVLRLLDVLIVNETEAGIVLGGPAPRSRDEAASAARRLSGRGPGHVLITLGADGAVWSDGPRAGSVPAPPVEAVVDTTGAGDAVVGVLAAGLAAGLGFPEAVRAAVRAGSLSVGRAGAADSYGTFELEEVSGAGPWPLTEQGDR